MRKIIKYLYAKYPTYFWEVMTADMVGNIPKNTQAVADDFLKTAGAKWEAWLLHQSWKIQRKASIEAKHHDSYLGMMAIIAWLLHLATRTPVKMTKTEMKAPKKEVNPQEGVDEFLKGMGITKDKTK